MKTSLVRQFGHSGISLSFKADRAVFGSPRDLVYELNADDYTRRKPGVRNMLLSVQWAPDAEGKRIDANITVDSPREQQQQQQQRVVYEVSLATPFAPLQFYSEKINWASERGKGKYGYESNAVWKKYGERLQMKEKFLLDIRNREFLYQFEDPYTEIKLSGKYKRFQKSLGVLFQHNQIRFLDMKLSHGIDRQQTSFDGTLTYEGYDNKGKIVSTVQSDNRETVFKADFVRQMTMSSYGRRGRQVDDRGSCVVKHNSRESTAELRYTDIQGKDSSVDVSITKDLPRGVKGKVSVEDGGRALFKLDADYSKDRNNDHTVNINMKQGDSGSKLTTAARVNVSGRKKTSHLDIATDSMDLSMDGSVRFDGRQLAESQLRVGSTRQDMEVSGEYMRGENNGKHQMTVDVQLPQRRTIKAVGSFDDSRQKTVTLRVDAPRFRSLQKINLTASYLYDSNGLVLDYNGEVLPYVAASHLHLDVPTDMGPRREGSRRRQRLRRPRRSMNDFKMRLMVESTPQWDSNLQVVLDSSPKYQLSFSVPHYKAEMLFTPRKVLMKGDLDRKVSWIISSPGSFSEISVDLKIKTADLTATLMANPHTNSYTANLEFMQGREKVVVTSEYRVNGLVRTLNMAIKSRSQVEGITVIVTGSLPNIKVMTSMSLGKDNLFVEFTNDGYFNRWYLKIGHDNLRPAVKATQALGVEYNYEMRQLKTNLTYPGQQYVMDMRQRQGKHVANFDLIFDRENENDRLGVIVLLENKDDRRALWRRARVKFLQRYFSMALRAYVKSSRGDHAVSGNLAWIEQRERGRKPTEEMTEMEFIDGADEDEEYEVRPDKFRDDMVGAKVQLRTKERSRNEARVVLASPGRNMEAATSLEFVKNGINAGLNFVPSTRHGDGVDVEVALRRVANQVSAETKVNFPHLNKVIRMSSLARGPDGQSSFMAATTFSVDGEVGSEFLMKVEGRGGTTVNTAHPVPDNSPPRRRRPGRGRRPRRPRRAAAAAGGGGGGSSGERSVVLTVSHPRSYLKWSLRAFLTAGSWSDEVKAGLEASIRHSRTAPERNYRLVSKCNIPRSEASLQLETPDNVHGLKGRLYYREDQKVKVVVDGGSDDGSSAGTMKQLLELSASKEDESFSFKVYPDGQYMGVGVDTHLNRDKLSVQVYRPEGYWERGNDATFLVERRPQSTMFFSWWCDYMGLVRIKDDAERYLLETSRRILPPIHAVYWTLFVGTSRVVEQALEGNLSPVFKYVSEQAGQIATLGHKFIDEASNSQAYRFGHNLVWKDGMLHGLAWDFYCGILTPIWDAARHAARDLAEAILELRRPLEQFYWENAHSYYTVRAAVDQYRAAVTQYVTDHLDQALSIVSAANDWTNSYIRGLEAGLMAAVSELCVALEQVYHDMSSVFTNKNQNFYHHFNFRSIVFNILNFPNKAMSQLLDVFTVLKPSTILISITDQFFLLYENKIKELRESLVRPDASYWDWNPQGTGLTALLDYRLVTTLNTARHYIVSSVPDTQRQEDSQLPGDSLQSTMVDYHYGYRPNFDRRSWLPPYKARATIFMNRHVTTFDGTYYNMTGSCDYTLSHVPDNFRIEAQFDPVSETLGSLSIDFPREKLKFRIPASGDAVILQEDQDRISYLAFPYTKDEVSVESDYRYRDHEETSVVFTHNRGIRITLHPKFQLFTVEISGWYFARVSGILGTYNGEPNDDTIQQGISRRDYYDNISSYKKRADPIGDFLSSYAVGTDCMRSSGDIVLPPSDHYMESECSWLFTDRQAFVGDCFDYVDKTRFLSMCTLEARRYAYFERRRGLSQRDATMNPLCKTSFFYRTECLYQNIAVYPAGYCYDAASE
ncbi:hypothetical protein Ahia01_000905700 [Argonauta hians]